MSFGLNTIVGAATGAVVAGPIGLVAGAGIGAMMDISEDNRRSMNYQAQQQHNAALAYSRHAQEEARAARKHEIFMAQQKEDNARREVQAAEEKARREAQEARAAAERAKKEELYAAENATVTNWINQHHPLIMTRIDKLRRSTSQKPGEFRSIVAEIEDGTRTSRGYLINSKVNVLISELSELYEHHMKIIEGYDNILRECKDYEDQIRELRSGVDFNDLLQRINTSLKNVLIICDKKITPDIVGPASDRISELKRYSNILVIRAKLLSGRINQIPNLSQIFELFNVDDFLRNVLFERTDMLVKNLKHNPRIEYAAGVYKYMRRSSKFIDVSDMYHEFERVLNTDVLQNEVKIIVLKEKSSHSKLITKIEELRAVFTQSQKALAGDNAVIDYILSYYEKECGDSPPIYSRVDLITDIPPAAEYFFEKIGSLVGQISHIKTQAAMILVNPFSIRSEEISEMFGGRQLKRSTQDFIEEITHTVNSYLTQFRHFGQLRKVEQVKRMILENLKLSKWDKKIRIINQQTLKDMIVRTVNAPDQIDLTNQIDEIYENFRTTL